MRIVMIPGLCSSTYQHTSGSFCQSCFASFLVLIVMATHGYSGIKRWALGSVADKVLRSSRRPLLVFRPKLQRIEEELREAFASATTG